MQLTFGNDMAQNAKITFFAKLTDKCKLFGVSCFQVIAYVIAACDK
jgi:hypothetical protein